MPLEAAALSATARQAADKFCLFRVWCVIVCVPRTQGLISLYTCCRVLATVLSISLFGAELKRESYPTRYGHAYGLLNYTR